MSKKETTTDDLAGMVKRGFDGVTREIGQVKQEVVKLREQNGREHEDIKLRLDNAAWRFELKALDGRVTFLEKKAKFA